MSLADFDPEIAQSIRDETERENNTLEMIASENFVSAEVQEAQGSVMTNKYAEGYPCLLYTSPSPRDRSLSRMPSSA